MLCSRIRECGESHGWSLGLVPLCCAARKNKQQQSRCWTNCALERIVHGFQEQLVEYACHEGNVGLEFTLSAARAKEREEAAAAAREQGK
jgi:hypothetical protein